MRRLLLRSASLLVAVSIISAASHTRQVFAQSDPQATQQKETAPKEERRRLESEVKQLVAEGKALEQQGELMEARDKYVDAEGIVSTDEALSAIRQVDDEQEQRVETLLDEAHRSYDTGQFSDSNQQLQQALQMQPSNAALQYDLALAYLRQGDRPNAVQHLDMTLGALSDEKERAGLLELRSTILMGTAAPVATGNENETSPASTFNDTLLQEDRDPGDTSAAGGSSCDQTRDLQTALPTNAAVVFNSAKCAAEEARPEDAIRQLTEYIKLAPEALDHTDAVLYQQTLSSLANLPGDSGQLVRQHYAKAARYLDYRRYDRAIGEYEAALQVLPNYPETQWELGLLYEAYGDIAKANERFSNFQQLEPDQTRRSNADSHLSTLGSRRAVYDANITQAQEIMSSLLLRSLGLNNLGVKHKTRLTYRQWRWASKEYKETTRATEKLSQPYVERELNRARVDLESATDLFPLGAEANELLALLNLQSNDWPEAYRNYDAVASQALPVSFYAQVYSVHDSNAVRAAKVEIGTHDIRLLYLSSYDAKRHVSMPPNKPAGEDDLGNLVVSPGQPPDAQAEALTIRAVDLKGIETDKNFVVLKLPNDQIYIAPLNMLGEVPFEGKASRTFGNEYTRLFVRYLGYEEARLGKEGMTAGEKFMLGFEIARIGVSVGMMGVGVPVVYGSGVRMARLVHALRVYHDVRQGIRVANAADAATRLVDDLQMDIAVLERDASDQQLAIGGMEFKVIPTQQLPLKFRDKF
jgi:tetratricopeptide (TPR) repeat protein